MKQNFAVWIVMKNIKKERKTKKKRENIPMKISKCFQKNNIEI